MQHTIVTPIGCTHIGLNPRLEYKGHVDGGGDDGQIVGSRDGSCKFCSQNLYRGECLSCLNGSYGPADEAELLEIDWKQLASYWSGRVCHTCFAPSTSYYASLA